MSRNTPSAKNGSESEVDWEQAREATRLLLDALGEDPRREGLRETWQRRVPSAFDTLTEGTRESAKPTLRTFPTEESGLVIKTEIDFYSLCEHHLLPFHGEAHIAYRPNGEIVGLSKLIRYVRWKSRQLTVQEELTREIATGIADEINAEAVVVELSATHLCEAMRGIESKTTTTSRYTVGDLSDEECRRFEDAVNRTHS